MPGTIEMGMAKAHNGRIIVLITGTIFVHFLLISTIQVMGNGIGIGAQLNNTERYTSTRKGMPHPIRSDNGIYILHLGIGKESQSHH